MKNKEELVKILLAQDLKTKEKKELFDLLLNEQITINIEKEEESKLTFGDKAADKFSEFAGSWKFIIGFSLFLLLWIIVNGLVLNSSIDPYPFILLNLLLSCLAAIQAPIIMMSQNRQEKKDSLRNQNDYQVDLKSELLLEDLHNKLSQILKNEEKIIKSLKKYNIK